MELNFVTYVQIVYPTLEILKFPIWDFSAFLSSSTNYYFSNFNTFVHHVVMKSFKKIPQLGQIAGVTLVLCFVFVSNFLSFFLLWEGKGVLGYKRFGITTT